MWIALGEDVEGGSRRLRRGSREWRAAWKALAELTGDRAPRWEYVASFRDRGRWTHEFCHRHHPVKQRRWYAHVPASPQWTPEAELPAPRRTLH